MARYSNKCMTASVLKIPLKNRICSKIVKNWLIFKELTAIDRFHNTLSNDLVLNYIQTV